MNKFNSELRQPQLRSRGWATAVFLATLLFLLLAVPAHAHTRVEIGPYVFVVGWTIEPPVVGERNAISVEIYRDGQPVEGAEADLRVEILYAGIQYRTILLPTETPGYYTADLFPTVRGQYSVRLFGTVEDMELDEVIDPEEVFPASRIHFPEPLPDPRELQRHITELESQLQTTRTLALAGVGVGVLGILLALLTFLHLRSKGER